MYEDADGSELDHMTQIAVFTVNLMLPGHESQCLSRVECGGPMASFGAGGRSQDPTSAAR